MVCTKLNKLLCANIASGEFVTFFYAVLDASPRTLTYENAGHSPGHLMYKHCSSSLQSFCRASLWLAA